MAIDLDAGDAETKADLAILLEQYGAGRAAGAAYRKVHASEDAREPSAAAHDLARRRLADIERRAAP